MQTLGNILNLIKYSKLVVCEKPEKQDLDRIKKFIINQFKNIYVKYFLKRKKNNNQNNIDQI